MEVRFILTIMNKLKSPRHMNMTSYIRKLNEEYDYSTEIYKKLNKSLNQFFIISQVNNLQRLIANVRILVE